MDSYLLDPEQSTVKNRQGPLRAWMPWIITAILILVGIILRWSDLEVRPLHHDESLHGRLSLSFHNNPERHYYKYNPLLHGPFLYHALNWTYELFGDSKWAIRSPMALIGSFFLLLPWIFRKHFSPIGVCALTAAFALSPLLIYWSRFIRHDYFFLLWVVLMLYGLIGVRSRYKSLIVLPALALQVCTKENFFVLWAIILGYLVFEFGYRAATILLRGLRQGALGQTFALFRRLSKDSWFRAASSLKRSSAELFRESWIFLIPRHIGRYPVQFALGSLFAVGLYAYFYSAGFRYEEGITKGPFTTGFEYWIAQHEKERLRGPFLFQSLVIGIYEFPLVLLGFLHLGIWYRRANTWLRGVGALAWAAGVFLCWHYLDQDVAGHDLWKTLKLKSSLDILAIFVLAVHAVLITLDHLLRNERVLAFWGYLFFAHFWTYSYLGERVPWLSTYPLVTGMIYYVLFADHHFKRFPWYGFRAVPAFRILRLVALATLVLALLFSTGDGLEANLPYVIVGVALIILADLDRRFQLFGRSNLLLVTFVLYAGFSLYVALITNFGRAGHFTELLCQVHTSRDLERWSLYLREESLAKSEAARPAVLVDHLGREPSLWYFRGLTNFEHRPPKDSDYGRFDHILIEGKRCEQERPGYSCEIMPLRGWWVPDYRTISVKALANYILFHDPWSGTGFTRMLLYTKVAEEPGSEEKPANSKSPEHS